MKIKTTFEFSDGTTITLTREQVEELRAALAVPAKPLPLETKRDVDRALAEEILRKQERDAARDPKPWHRPCLWDGTEWIGTPIPILCETTQ